MPLNLATLTAGSGKTRYVIAQIRASCRSRPFLQLLVILPLAGNSGLSENDSQHTLARFCGITLTSLTPSTAIYSISLARCPARLEPEAACYYAVHAVIG